MWSPEDMSAWSCIFFYKWTGKGVKTGMTEYIGSTSLLPLVLECGSYTKLWVRVGCGWLIKGYVKLTMKQSSSDVMYPAMASGLHVLRRVTLDWCSFKGNISLVFSKWVKNVKGLLGPTGEAHWERAGNKGEALCLSAAAKWSWPLCFILALLSQKGELELGRSRGWAVRVLGFLQTTFTWGIRKKVRNSLFWMSEILCSGRRQLGKGKGIWLEICMPLNSRKNYLLTGTVGLYLKFSGGGFRTNTKLIKGSDDCQSQNLPVL